jgi:branched-chain amino acid aminotransferase
MTFSLVHLHGKLVPAEGASISIHDRGFLLGDGLFETMRAYGGRPAFLGEHLARLRHGCDALRIPFPDDLPARVAETLAAHGAPDCAVRVTLTRGPGGRGASPRGSGPPTVLVALAPIPYSDDLYERGLRVVVSRIPRAPSPDAALKTTNYLANVMARLEADDAGADEALFADAEGRLLEATQANLLVVRGGELATPPLGAILPGVTRAKLLALAPEAGLRPVERPLTRADLADADEAMLCASVLEVAPLAQLDGRPVRRGPVAQKLRALYRLQAKSDG